MPARLVQVGHENVPGHLAQIVVGNSQDLGEREVPLGPVVPFRVMAVEVGVPHITRPVAVPLVVPPAVAVELAQETVGTVLEREGLGREARVLEHVRQLPDAHRGAVIVALLKQPDVVVESIRVDRSLRYLGRNLRIVRVEYDLIGGAGQDRIPRIARIPVDLAHEVVVERKDLYRAVGVDVMIVKRVVVVTTMDVVVENDRPHAVIGEVVRDVVDHVGGGVDAVSVKVGVFHPDPLRYPGHAGRVAVVRLDHVAFDVDRLAVYLITNERHDVLAERRCQDFIPARTDPRRYPVVE